MDGRQGEFAEGQIPAKRLPGLPLIPTGGISIDNFVDFLKSGAVAVGFGSALLPRSLVEVGQWQELSAHARRFAETLKAYDAERGIG